MDLKIENKFEDVDSTHSNMGFLWSHANLMLNQERGYCKDPEIPKSTTEIPMISYGKNYSAKVRHNGHMT